MTHGRVPCVYRMRRTWSSSSCNKNSSMGRRLRWNQAENSLKLSLTLKIDDLLVGLQRSLTAMPGASPGHSPKFFVRRRLRRRQRSYFHARTAAHRGRHGELAQIHTLGGGRTSLVQGIDQGDKVGLQLLNTERCAAGRG